MQRRIIAWEGFHNARDLGGLPTRDGSMVRFGQLIRSADLRFVTAAGWRSAYAAGVRTVVDLRNDEEVQPVEKDDIAANTGSARFVAETHRTALPPGVRLVRVALDGVEDVELWRYLNEERLNGTPLYFTPFLERRPDRVGAVITAIARADPGGVIFHCGAGRDRTGLIGLLLLALAGVDADVIADDYEMTAEPLRTLHARLGRDDEELQAVAQAMADKGTTVRAAIRATLTGFNVTSYLMTAGVTATDLAALRRRLLG